VTIATHEAQQDVLERWARGRGCWLALDVRETKSRWQVFSVREGIRVMLLGAGPATWTMPPPIALAWALLVELDVGTLDVGPCPACLARSGSRKLVAIEWAQDEWEGQGCLIRARGSVQSYGRRGWTTVLEKRPRTRQPRRQAHVVVRASRPCQACDGTGREHVTLAQAFLTAVDFGAAMANLQVEADRRLASGCPAGLALAWGIRWSEDDEIQDGTGEVVLLLHWLEAARAKAAYLEPGIYTISINGREHEYSVPEAGEGRTTTQIRDELERMFNEPRGPVTTVVASAATAGTYTVAFGGAEPVTFEIGHRPTAEIVGEALEAMAEAERARDPRRRQHARHVGQQLGRRLGIRQGAR
jgi:hypothetical protein